MKKTIVFVFLFFSISVFAQQNKWDVGIVGGPGITAIRHTNSRWYKPDPTIGFYTGLSAQYNFSQHFAIHTELAFDRKGTSDKITLTDPHGNDLGAGKITNQLNYLTLPVFFRASVGNDVQYFIQSGPYLSYLLNQTIKYSSNVFNETRNYTSQTPAMDFGISAGLGVAIPVKEKFAVSCEIRGSYGLVDLYSKGSRNTKGLNQSLNFFVGISYKLGK